MECYPSVNSICLRITFRLRQHFLQPFFIRRNRKSFLMRKNYESRFCARGLFHEAAGGAVYGDVGGAESLAEMGGKRGGQKQRIFAWFSSVRAQNDMGAGDIFCVQP